jgi:hypothetical protein
MRAYCMAVLLSLSVSGCAAEPDQQHTARVAMAERYGLAPHDVTISTRGAVVLSVRETRPMLRSPDESARLARELAREVGRLHDSTVHGDSVTVRFVRLFRSDVRTFRFVTSYSFTAAELLAGGPFDTPAPTAP